MEQTIPPHYFFFQSPLGWMQIGILKGIVFEINFCKEEVPSRLPIPPAAGKNDRKAYLECRQQLQEYFEGKRFNFQLNAVQYGTSFRKRVWKELLNIPYGKTISYRQLAEQIGDIKAVRAVGNANGNNNLTIIVPCHRVIGSDGSLTGYGSGIWRKEWLLEHENKFGNGVQSLF